MQILVVPKNKYLQKPSNQSLDNFINTESIYLERNLAESDPTYLQIIPYIVLNKGESLFVYSRLKQSGEQRLHGKYSVGVGGHVDKIEGLSPLDCLNHNIYKELYEELYIEDSTSFLDVINTNKIIYDDSNEVGRVHLGILYTCDVTDRDVSVKETEKIEGSFLTRKEITEISLSSDKEFETWTRIALNHLGVPIA